MGWDGAWGGAWCGAWGGAGTAVPDDEEESSGTAITWTDVVAFAPGLSRVTTAARAAILAHVNVYLDVCLFGGEDSPQVRLLRIYLAAHHGTLAVLSASGAAGPVTSESAGGLSRSYAFAGANAGNYGSTSWGQLYNAIVRASPARVGFAF